MIPTNCKTLVITALFLETLTLPVRAANFDFEQIVIFGDSLSDTGNFYGATGGNFPSEPFFGDGRFSNGWVWVDYFAQDFGLNPTTFYGNSLTDPTDGINFAFGSAKSGESGIAGSFVPGFTTQINDYIEFLDGARANEEALYIIWSGSNDYLDPTNPVSNPEESIANLSNGINQLIDLGAQNFLIANLPNLGDTPVGNNFRDTLNSLTQEHNSLLTTEVTNLSNQANLFYFDANSLFAEFFSNPDKFGFRTDLDNPTREMLLESCTNVSVLNVPSIEDFEECINSDEYIYWDDQHPGTKTHEFIAEEVLKLFQADPQDPEPIDEPKNIIGLIALGIGLLGKIAQRKN